MGFYQDSLDSLERDGRRRRLAAHGDGLTDFSSNDYLGFAGDPRLIQAAAHLGGYGSRASRLITGTRPEHVEFERAIAAWHGAEAALFFSTGFQANVGLIPAIAASVQRLISDRLNHASLIDGCRLASVPTTIVDHLDAAAMHREARVQPALIITESTFSMDGDRPDLAALASTAEATGSQLYVDEAHSVGVLGPQGRGLAAKLQLRPDFVLGTLGKAFGASGAYVACSRPAADYLVNTCRSFVFSTAPPASMAAVALKALELVASAEGDERRVRLEAHVERVAACIQRLGGSGAGGPIQPYVLGTEAAALRASAVLAERGLRVLPIRPPTVPRGTARLRISLSAAHSDQDIDRLVAGLEALAQLSLSPE